MCFIYAFYFILFIYNLVFLTNGIRVKGNLLEKRFLFQVVEMAKDGKFRVKKFNGQNCQLWKMHMEDYLYQKDLFLPLGGIEKNLIATKDKE
jgi:hypothetical protein